jgi:hypothetical protein
MSRLQNYEGRDWQGMRHEWDVSEIICFVGQRNNGRENSSLTIVHNSISWGPRHRWKVLPSCYIRCDVPDGIDVAQGVSKPRMNVRALCNVGSFCTCWATACFTRRQCCGLDDQGFINQCQAGEKFSVIFKASRQPLRPAEPPIQSVLRVKWLGQEANHLSESSAKGRMCGAVGAVPPHPSIPSLCGD